MTTTQQLTGSRKGCPGYRVRMWDGHITVQWLDETDAEWTSRQSEADPHSARFTPATVTRRQIRDGKWLTCGARVH